MATAKRAGGSACVKQAAKLENVTWMFNGEFSSPRPIEDGSG